MTYRRFPDPSWQPPAVEIEEVRKTLKACSKAGGMAAARAVLRITGEQIAARPQAGDMPFFAVFLIGTLLLGFILSLFMPGLERGRLIVPLLGLAIGPLFFGYHLYQRRHFMRRDAEENLRIARMACEVLEKIMSPSAFVASPLEKDEKQTVRRLMRTVPSARATLARLL